MTGDDLTAVTLPQLCHYRVRTEWGGQGQRRFHAVRYAFQQSVVAPAHGFATVVVFLTVCQGDIFMLSGYDARIPLCKFKRIWPSCLPLSRTIGIVTTNKSKRTKLLNRPRHPRNIFVANFPSIIRTITPCKEICQGTLGENKPDGKLYCLM